MESAKHETPSTAPFGVSAALLSATLAGTAPAAVHQEFQPLPNQGIRWDAPGASEPSFQVLDIFRGQTVSTTRSIDPDPWQQLEGLEDGWDGSGAKSVSQDAIDHARQFLKMLSEIEARFTPFAHPNGGVGLESEKPGKAVYLIVSPANRFTYVFRIGTTVHRGDDVDASKMRGLLALLY